MLILALLLSHVCHVPIDRIIIEKKSSFDHIGLIKIIIYRGMVYQLTATSWYT